MTVYKAAEQLQEALDLLTDMEKRREKMLNELGNIEQQAELAGVQVEAVLDDAYRAAVRHSIHCMAKFAQVQGAAGADYAEGS